MSEPIFHYFDDCLEETHNLYNQRNFIACTECEQAVVANNEFMNAWFETAVGVICLKCFYAEYEDIYNGPWTFERHEIK